MAHLLQGDSLNYMYLLQEREFIKTKEAVYKLGKTTKVNHTRFNQYPKGSVLLFQIICQNCNSMEPLLLNMFKEHFFKRVDIGNEYFEGDCDQMIHIIYSAVREEKMCKQHLQPTINFTIPKHDISQELKQIKQQEKEARQKWEKEKKLAKIQKIQERIGLIEHANNDKKLAISPELQWLEAFTRDHHDLKEVECLGVEIYGKFMRWCSESGIEYHTTAQKMGIKISNLKVPGITKGRHTNKGDTKIYNITELKKYFKIGAIVSYADGTSESKN